MGVACSMLNGSSTNTIACMAYKHEPVVIFSHLLAPLWKKNVSAL